jgi:hypothetical protein
MAQNALQPQAAPVVDDDPALVTASELIFGVVCECGHCDTDHRADRRQCEECDCRRTDR